MLRSIVLAVVVVVVINSSCWAEGYSSIEVYPSGSVFFCAGRGLMNGKAKIDVWSNAGAEVGATVGPTIGPFGLGIGTSAVNADGLKLGYVNLDLGFGVDIGPVNWQSYNLYQVGRGGLCNFALSRNWLSYKGFPLGIVGHNIKIGDDSTLPFWGVYVQIGEMGSFSSSRLCLAVNVRDRKSLWAAWNIGL